MELDTQTKEQISAGEHLRNMTESEGWKILEPVIKEKILDLQNINNVDTTTPDSMMVDIKARKIAADILFGLLKQDVYGRIEQAKNAAEALTDHESPEFIDRG